MFSNGYEVVGDDFRLGYRHQDEWGFKIAFAFFFGEVGAGLFFVSAFYNYLVGMIIGWVMVTVCKPTALFMHLGQPLRAWRAIMHLDRSWISRGLFFSILYTGFGGGHILNLKYHIVGGGLATFIYVIGMLACLGVMIYLGFVLSYSAAIPLWDTALMPIISLTYGLMGGVTLMLLFAQNFLNANAPHAVEMLEMAELGLVLFCGVLLWSFLHGAAYGPSAARKSVTLLLKEKFAKYFIPLVCIVGIVIVALLSAFGPTNTAVLLIIAVCELIGDIGLKLLLFKAGTYEPTLSHVRY